MSSAGQATPRGGNTVVIERLLGERGQEDQVIETARTVAVRAAPAFSDRLNAKLSSPVTIDLKGVEIVRMSDAKPPRPESYALTVASSPLSSDTLVMMANAAAVSILVSVLFGGDSMLPIVPIERGFSPTELDVAGAAFHELAHAVNGWGDRSLDIRFPLPKAITGDELKRKALRDGPAVRLIFTIAFGETQGAIAVFIPQRVLMHRTGGHPSETADWRPRMNAELMRSAVGLEAVVSLGRMTLGEIARLRQGEVIPLPPSAQAQARLNARDKTLFICEFGKLGQNYTVRVRQPFDAGQDFLDGLMPELKGNGSRK